MKPEQQAAKWFAEGVKASRAFDRQMKQVRKDGIDAAFHFMRARDLAPHGTWGEFCELHREEISPRMVRLWVQLAEEAIAWVREAHPTIKTLDGVHAAARELVMQSPKPLVALCRELGQMRKFGEYDAVKYATKKLGAGAQIEFDFDKMVSAVELLSHLGDENYSIKYPESKDETEALKELRDKMRSAAQRIDMIIEHGRVIET